MRIRKKGVKLFALLATAGLLAAGWIALKPSENQKLTQTATNQNGQPVSQAPAEAQTNASLFTQYRDDPNLPYIETAEFKYKQPPGWAQMSQKALDAAGASSGMGRPISPAATFTIKVSSSTPRDDNDLKDSTLNELKKFSNFKLILNTEARVDNKTGQKFTYNFSDRNNENPVSQEMNVIVNNKKTFFLLFSSSSADFDKQSDEFNKIIGSFQFK